MKRKMPVPAGFAAFTAFALFTVASHAQTKAEKHACPANAPFLNADAVKKAGVELPVFKRYCYTDKSGSYALVLSEKQDLPFADETLSSVIQATLFRVGGDNVLTRQWSIRDFAGKEDAGINFRSKLFEFADLDADGLIEPILVYRFFAPDDKDGFDSDDFSGGIKIIAFHQGRKVVVHAITGILDGQRSTRANADFFALPKPVRQHLVRKMAAMYSAGQFGFDNSNGFMPKKARAR
ncbi:M949_RS01915 family surface polysaccharide biosynthesis protein [Variovorax paradoxus]|uniref:M949_RS01915 family surface polysaccharide biosynthesis protein n=1 Tax=Variovorax paradoxus TaxID=34073 RepID=UPI003394F357